MKIILQIVINLIVVGILKYYNLDIQLVKYYNVLYVDFIIHYGN
jgi:phage shock protein PspC (stress-responsive transcriptional regulator)